MNRHERRKAAKLFEASKETIDQEDVNRMTTVCAWEGCTATAPTAKIPDDWVKVLAYRGKTRLTFAAIPASDMLRDCVLCAAHGATFDGQLKELTRLGPMAGRA